MINTSDIVGGHNLSPKELEKYKNDKVNSVSFYFDPVHQNFTSDQSIHKF